MTSGHTEPTEQMERMERMEREMGAEMNQVWRREI